MNKSLKPEKNSPDWMVVYQTNDIRDAHIIAGRLHAEDIEHYIHAQPGASAIGITMGAMGTINVLVRPADYSQAEFILYGDEEEPDPYLEDDTDTYIYGWEDDEHDDNNN